MELKVELFKDGKTNSLFTCGMVDSPYMGNDRCKRLAVAHVTEEGWVEYTNYRMRYNKVKKCNCHKSLALLMHPLICQHHLDLVGQLHPSPKVAGSYHG